jgi:hypothetical protein
MKQTRIIKRTKAPGHADPSRSSLDPRDPDVVRAKALSTASSNRSAPVHHSRAA